MTTLPSLFISHGSPMMALTQTPAHEFLGSLGAQIDRRDRPRAILCVSAHWESRQPVVSSASVPETIYDFGGFPDELYQLRYPAPGAPDLAERVVGLLADAGLPCDRDLARGLDHGAWIPLLLGYPAADIPVTQLSIQHHLGPAHQYAVGQALAPLRREGVLILCSGAITHNLADVQQRRAGGVPVDGPSPDWAAEFEAWVVDRVEAGAMADLVNYRAGAPHAAMAHPRDEHFLPLLTAAGAGGEAGRTMHRSFEWGSLGMAAFAFG
ncbi:MAG: class III extradiol ring-cleavage dioxygenase [Proteobacteria bacterium]|nr:class III extradiol ring-cleavage dioxygenase [Pseudomonadota bacterium]